MLLTAALLGAIQGFTEFLPISGIAATALAARALTVVWLYRERAKPTVD